MIIKPMPSPGGTNREKLFILQGGKGPLNRRGMAYDSMGRPPRTAAASLTTLPSPTPSSRSLPGRKKI
jgi:hypothetical protein